MPKQRATGAAKPYTYWHTYKVKDKDGRMVTKRTQRWMVRVDLGYDASGRRIRKTLTGKTSEAVKEKLKDARKKLAENGYLDGDDIKLGEYARQWLEHKTHEADPKTIEMYRTIVDRHFARYSGTRLTKIVPSTVRTILEDAQAYDQKGKPKGSAGVSLKRQIRTCLNQIMQAAWADRLIPSNPVQAVKTPSRKDQGEGRSAFSVPELRAMLEVASQKPVDEGAIWWWRMLTGMRQGEILGATWDSLDLRRGIYTVDWKLQTVTKVHGCGDPKNGIYPCRKKKPSLCPDAQWLTPDGYDMKPLCGPYALTRPKSRTGRIVPIVPPLAEVMRRYRKAVKGRPSPYGLIFAREDGTPISKKQDMAAFRKLMEEAHIDPQGHTGHETRYSAVTLLASQGVDLQLIQEIVGHSSEAMTMHYRTAGLEERKQAMLKIDSALGIE